MNVRPKPAAAQGLACTDGLAALEARLAEDLERLCLPATDWLRRSADDPVLDVAIVGGGMAGLAVAAQLWLLGVHRIRLFERNARGSAGPWVTHARMQTLRSPKHLVGPALGLASLTFRAWFEAQFGKRGWEALDRIERAQWQAYLDWFAQVLALPVTYDTEVSAIAGHEPGSEPDRVGFDVLPSGTSSGKQADARRQRLFARHIVLATGMDGFGGPVIPAVSSAIDRERWQHSTECIDFAALKGKRIAVVGGGDSALDAAATGIENGAASVDVFMRSANFTRINYWKAFTHPGHYLGFTAMAPRARQPMLDFLKNQKVPPAHGTMQRVLHLPNIHLHFSSPVNALATDADGSVVVSTPHGQWSVDKLIFATGYQTDLARRHELASLAPHVRFWCDREPDHTAAFSLDGFPDLADDFSLKEREPGTCPALRRIHLFTSAALMSHGKLTGDIPGVGLGAEKLARGIAIRLYEEDFDAQFRAVQDYNELEVEGDEWAGMTTSKS